MAGPTTLHMRSRPPDSAPPVNTIVLVMLENRSFDHLLGWMSLRQYDNRRDIEGLKGEIDSSTKELTEPAYRNRARNRVWRPYLADKDNWLVSDLPHGRDLVHTQMHENRGSFAMDGFAEAQFTENPKYPKESRPDSLMMMRPELIPATAFLARKFMVCDHWFSPIPTDTHPNRLVSLCGFTKIDQTSGEPIPLPDHESVLDYCDDRNVRWRVYRESLSFITLFTALRPHGLEADHKHFRGLSDLAHDFRSESAATFPNLVIVEPAYSDDPFFVMKRADLSAPPGPESPRVPTDNHPPNPMAYGEAFLAEVYRAVTSNPERWASTVMIVVYDEHGGFFDHVPPFRVTTPMPGYENDAWKDKNPFVTTGPRVPAIIVSPLVAPGSATSLRFDHTSVLQLLADVAEPGHAFSEIVEKRRQEGAIHRISEVLADGPVQEKPPKMPLFKLAWPGNAAPPRVVNRSMQAFENLREVLAAPRKDAIAAFSRAAGSKIRLGARNYIAARNIGVGQSS